MAETVAALAVVNTARGCLRTTFNCIGECCGWSDPQANNQSTPQGNSNNHLTLNRDAITNEQRHCGNQVQYFCCNCLTNWGRQKIPPTVLPGAVLPRAVLPGTVLPGAVLPGTVLPGTVLSEAVPPGVVPSGVVPSGATPPGTSPRAVPPGTLPPGTAPGAVLPGVVPPGVVPPGVVPSGATPPGTSPGAVPPGAVPQGTLPPGTAPGAVPQGTLPPGTAPGAVLPGVVPPGVVPSGATPPGTSPGAVPPGTLPPGTAPGAVHLGVVPPVTILGAAPPGAAPFDNGNTSSEMIEERTPPYGHPGQARSFDLRGLESIKIIEIHCGSWIDSLRFQYMSGGKLDWTPQVGGGGGDVRTIELNDEHITEVTGEYAFNSETGMGIIARLRFTTNRNRHIGPYGEPNAWRRFRMTFIPFHVQGRIVGFHGTAAMHISSIGFYKLP